jgi:hypothetical protein
MKAAQEWESAVLLAPLVWVAAWVARMSFRNQLRTETYPQISILRTAFCLRRSAKWALAVLALDEVEEWVSAWALVSVLEWALAWALVSVLGWAVALALWRSAFRNQLRTDIYLPLAPT